MTPPSNAVHWLLPDSPILEETLPKIMTLSNDILTPEPGSKHESVTRWREHLSHPTSAIVYLSLDSDDAIPYGFLFVYPRNHAQPLSSGATESLHIWMAGVSPSHRRTGALQRMTEALFSKYTGVATVCTIPSRFPDMWAWLIKRGWTVERDLEDGKILLSKRV